MVLNFVNFYKRFIRNFSKIINSLTLILCITNKVTKVDYFNTKTRNIRRNKEIKDNIRAIKEDTTSHIDKNLLNIRNLKNLSNFKNSQI